MRSEQQPERSPAVVERGGRAEITARPVHDLIPGRTATIGPGTEVRRLLPTLGRRMVGAWCFLDHYGPDDVSAGDGMNVAPHPHTGLQTVSWLLDGDVHHKDSLGSDALIRPGQLGLMTSGHGIAHSEQSPTPVEAPGAGTLLHGTQLWVALPDGVRDRAPSWEFHTELPELDEDGVHARVVLGEFAGMRSPATVHTPIVGAELRLAPGSSRSVPVEPDFEYAVITVSGAPVVDGVTVPVGSLLYLGAGRPQLRVAADTDSRLMLLGGEPFEENIVMWWNFVGRSHEEILGFRGDWEQHERFADVPGWGGKRLDAPPVPVGQLKARSRGR